MKNLKIVMRNMAIMSLIIIISLMISSVINYINAEEIQDNVNYANRYVLETRNNSINSNDYDFSIPEIDNEALHREPEVIEESQEEEQSMNYLGYFKLTYYCSCSKCCGKWANGITASGAKLKPWRTIAVDKRVIPLGTEVYIESLDSWFIAEDVGGAIKGNKIDVAVSSHQEALRQGIGYSNVYVK